MFAGDRDIDVAVAELAARAARRRCSRWRAWPTTTAGPGRPTAPPPSRPSTPSAGSAAAPTRAGCSPRRRRRRCERAAADAALVGRGRAPGAANCSADRERALARPARPAPQHPVAFCCAEFGVHGSLPIYSGGLGVAGRRHPEGGLRPGAADGRRRPDVPQRLLPPAHRRHRLAARVLARHRPRAPALRAGHAAPTAQPLTVTRAGRRRGRGRAGLARRRRPRAALPARHRPAREQPGRPLDHLAAVRRQPRDPPGAVRACSASAACGRCARMGIEPAVVPPQRGPRGAWRVRAAGRRRARSRPGQRRRRPGSACASRWSSRPTRRCRRATRPTRATRC